MSETEALQAALAGEHAALYGVGVAGGKRSGARWKAATNLYEQHRRQRDQLTDLLTTAGETPVAAEPAYDLPQPVTTAAQATSLILAIERRLAAVYADLVEGAEQESTRTVAIKSLIGTSSTQLAWGGKPVALPGTA